MQAVSVRLCPELQADATYAHARSAGQGMCRHRLLLLMKRHLFAEVCVLAGDVPVLHLSDAVLGALDAGEAHEEMCGEQQPERRPRFLPGRR